MSARFHRFGFVPRRRFHVSPNSLSEIVFQAGLKYSHVAASSLAKTHPAPST
jgi:hypothetical protein